MNPRSLKLPAVASEARCPLTAPVSPCTFSVSLHSFLTCTSSEPRRARDQRWLRRRTGPSPETSPSDPKVSPIGSHLAVVEEVRVVGEAATAPDPPSPGPALPCRADQPPSRLAVPTLRRPAPAPLPTDPGTSSSSSSSNSSSVFSASAFGSNSSGDRGSPAPAAATAAAMAVGHRKRKGAGESGSPLDRASSGSELG